MGTPVDGDGVVDGGSITTGDSDAPERLDVYCVRCGYNLRGLPLTGNCPECALPIIDSREDRWHTNLKVMSHFRDYVTTAYIAHLLHAATSAVALIGLVAMAIGQATGNVDLPEFARLLVLGAYLLGMVLSVVMLIAWWLITSRCGESSLDDSTPRLRVGMRIAIVFTLLFQSLSYFLASVYLYGPAILATVVHLLAGFLVYLFALLYVRRLARTLGLTSVVHRARLALWATILVVPAGVAVAGMLVPASFVLIFLLRPLHLELRRLAPDIDAKD